MTDYSPLELSLPERTGQETVEQRLTALEETVPRLLEALQYTLSNLGAENFNAAALSRRSRRSARASTARTAASHS